MRKARWACNFCEKTQDEVLQLIAGPREVHICNECVSLCVDIISGKAKQPDGVGIVVAEASDAPQ